MGRNRGGYIVTSLGPVTVAPLPPFEWNGVERVEFNGNDIVNIKPVIVVEKPLIVKQASNNIFTPVNLYGANINLANVENDVLSVTLRDGSKYTAHWVFFEQLDVDCKSMLIKYDVPESVIPSLKTCDIMTGDKKIVFQLRGT